MKYFTSISFSIFFLLVLNSVFAQPTITNADKPVIGDNTTIFATDVTGVTEGPAGANITWDFSLLVPGDTAMGKVVDPVTTPYASSFTNSDLCGTDDTSYQYYKTAPNEYSLTGIANSALTIPYTDFQLVFAYPMTFGSSFSDNFEGTFFSGIQFYRTGSVTIDCDGYGTLKLPNGTYTDVLRIKYVQNIQDSFNIGVPQYYYYSFTTWWWMTPGTRATLFAYHIIITDIGFGPDTTYAGSYLKSTSQPTGLNKIPPYLTEFNAYPNPATDHLTIDYSSGIADGARITLHDVYGRFIKEILNEKNSARSNKIEFSTLGLSKGIYIIRMNSDGVIRNQKIMVQ